MLAIKKARKIILTNPEHPGAKVLAALVIALETNHPFPLNQLYTLDFEQFELALEVLAEWRLDRYYSSKGRLLDLSLQAADLQSA
jgi:hypothetical protein